MLDKDFLRRLIGDLSTVNSNTKDNVRDRIKNKYLAPFIDLNEIPEPQNIDTGRELKLVKNQDSDE